MDFDGHAWGDPQGSQPGCDICLVRGGASIAIWRSVVNATDLWNPEPFVRRDSMGRRHRHHCDGRFLSRARLSFSVMAIIIPKSVLES